MTSRFGQRGRLHGVGPLAAVLVLLGLTIVACSQTTTAKARAPAGGGTSVPQADQPIFPGACPPRGGQPPAANGGVSRVQLKVVSTGSSALALAPVCIAGQGPYPFVVDTGAGTSAFDTQLVKELHLAATGPAQSVAGAACTTTETPVAGPSWSVGGVPLEAQTVASIDLPGFGLRSAPAGLLGSDVLSRFGAVQLDYQHQSLALPGPEGPPTGPGTSVHGPRSVSVPPGISLAPPSTAVPLVVAQTEHDTGAFVPVYLGGRGPYQFLLDTGSSTTSIDPHVVSAAGLVPTGQHVPVSSIGCREDAQLVRSGPWSAGTLSLPPQTIKAISSPESGGEIGGLLGSDVLHGFGTVVIAYSAGTLFLASR